ncbi:hypothetical protein SANTM175S_01083 [Streptomyces antimycoticus]
MVQRHDLSPAGMTGAADPAAAPPCPGADGMTDRGVPERGVTPDRGVTTDRGTAERAAEAAAAPSWESATAGEVLSAYLHAQAGDFLRSLRLHRESGSDVREAAEAARLLRRAARRISGALYVYRPLTDTAWSDELRTELAWLSGTLAREHAYAERLDRLRGALHRLSGAGGPSDRSSQGEGTAAEFASSGEWPAEGATNGAHARSAARTARGGVTVAVDGAGGPSAPRAPEVPRALQVLPPPSRPVPPVPRAAASRWPPVRRKRSRGPCRGAGCAARSGRSRAAAPRARPERPGTRPGRPDGGVVRRGDKSGRTANGEKTDRPGRPGRGPPAGRCRGRGPRRGADRGRGPRRSAAGAPAHAGPDPGPHRGPGGARLLPFPRGRRHRRPARLRRPARRGQRRPPRRAGAAAARRTGEPAAGRGGGGAAADPRRTSVQRGRRWSTAWRRPRQRTPRPPASARTPPGTRCAICCGCGGTPWRCSTRCGSSRTGQAGQVGPGQVGPGQVGPAPRTPSRRCPYGCWPPGRRWSATATRPRRPPPRRQQPCTPWIAPATAYALGVLHADQRHEVEAARFAFGRIWRRVATRAS